VREGPEPDDQDQAWVQEELAFVNCNLRRIKEYSTHHDEYVGSRVGEFLTRLHISEECTHSSAEPSFGHDSECAKIW
jgi:hypothetical protein